MWPALNGVTGHFFADSNPSYPAGFMEDDAMARELWRVSEELVGYIYDASSSDVYRVYKTTADLFSAFSAGFFRYFLKHD